MHDALTFEIHVQCRHAFGEHKQLRMCQLEITASACPNLSYPNVGARNKMRNSTQFLHQHSTQPVGNPVMPCQNNSFSGTPVKAQSPPQHLAIRCGHVDAPETSKTSWECSLELNSMSNIVVWDRLKVRGGGCKTPSLRALNDQSSRTGGCPFGYVLETCIKFRIACFQGRWKMSTNHSIQIIQRDSHNIYYSHIKLQ